MYVEDLEEKDDLVNELMNDKGVCKTAPATPGLLKTISKNTLSFLDQLIILHCV